MDFISRKVLSNVNENEVYIPREVMCRDNIDDNTKFVFGIIFSECLRKMESLNTTEVSQATNLIRNYSDSIPLNIIMEQCYCGEVKAKRIQKELFSLTATLDIAALFYECELNYVTVRKPVCHLCEKGKTLHKMIDLVNTIIDRELHGNIHKHYFDDEMQLLREYNVSHSPELLNKVIDILKR